MTRAFTPAAVRGLIARESTEVFLTLLTISAEGLTEPIRVVYNTEDITSRGNLFVHYIFDILLPESGTDKLPEVRLSIDNVDLEIMRSLQATRSEPEVLLEIVLASDPDLVQMSLPGLKLHSVDYDLMTLSGTLTAGHQLQRVYPGYRFNKAHFPGLFR